jgi:hypothetical protein
MRAAAGSRPARRFRSWRHPGHGPPRSPGLLRSCGWAWVVTRCRGAQRGPPCRWRRSGLALLCQGSRPEVCLSVCPGPTRERQVDDQICCVRGRRRRGSASPTAAATAPRPRAPWARREQGATSCRHEGIDLGGLVLTGNHAGGPAASSGSGGCAGVEEVHPMRVMMRRWRPGMVITRQRAFDLRLLHKRMDQDEQAVRGHDQRRYP